MAPEKLAATVVSLLKSCVTDRIVAANAAAGVIRQAIVDNGLQDQFTAGELSALQQFEADLAALAASPVVAAMETRYSPTHQVEQQTIGVEVE